jgi:hypothetical protein
MSEESIEEIFADGVGELIEGVARGFAEYADATFTGAEVAKALHEIAEKAPAVLLELMEVPA